MAKRLAFFALAGASPVQIGWASPQRIVVADERVVTNAPEPFVEPRLAINPRDPSHLLAAAISFSSTTRTCAPFVSFDAGRSWKRSDLPKTDSERGGDPWVAFDSAGTAYVSCLHLARGEVGKRTATGVAVYRSTDQGRTWESPAWVPGSTFDRPVLVAGRGGNGAPLMYLVASLSVRGEGRVPLFPVVVSRSMDGHTFSEPVQILPNNLNNNGRTAVVLDDGSLLVAFTDIGPGTGGLFERFRNWVVRSKDHGQSFGVPGLLSDYAKGNVIEMAIDAFRGEVHAIWDEIEGPRAGIKVSRSGDGGRRWSEAVHVGDFVSGAKQLNPSLAVDSQGTMGIHWMDFRNDPEGKCYEPYFAASLDGGRTFLPAERLSLVPSCPKSPGNILKREGGATEDVAARWPEGGDYHGLLAAAPGRFYALWADSRTGVFQLRFTTIAVTPTRAPQ